MTFVAFRWELRKLAAQRRSYVGLAAGVILALAFVITLSVHSLGPTDVPFGREIRATWLAIPLVLLTFASAFGAPLVTALVAGDIVAAEDTNRTLKTILTRSAGRGSIYSAKALAALTYAATALALTALTAFVAGTISWGFHPLRSLSGETLTRLHGLLLVAAAYGLFLLPLAAIAGFALFLSTVTRNSAASLVGALLFALGMQLLAALPGLEPARPYLLPAQFEVWRTLFRTPFDGEAVLRAAWVCALIGGIPLAAGWIVFRRRDVA
jgi:ABC-2 type transport system permease protein